jgi:hypothetical protein
MAWHLHGNGSEIDIRPGHGPAEGGYASFPEARRAALARLDSEIGQAADDATKNALQARRRKLAAMSAADVGKERLSGPDGVEIDAAFEMVQAELGRERLARRPIVALLLALIFGVVALLALLNG